MDGTDDATVDYAAAWGRLVDRGDLRYLDPDADRDYWRAHGSSYGDRFPADESPEGLETIRRAAETADSALEVGPGTGRYTERIAPAVERTTVVDYSETMLEQVRDRLAGAAAVGVTYRHGRVPGVDVDPHDLVLTAWTAYSQRDVGAALDALVRATRETLVVVDGLGASPPHSRLLAEVRGEEPPTPVARARYLAGALEQFGADVDLAVDDAVRRHEAETPVAIARRLAPEADPTTVRSLADRLEPHLERTSAGVRYEYVIPAGVVVWERPDGWVRASRPSPSSVGSGSPPSGRPTETEPRTDSRETDCRS